MRRPRPRPLLAIELEGAEDGEGAADEAPDDTGDDSDDA